MSYKRFVRRFGRLLHEPIGDPIIQRTLIPNPTTGGTTSVLDDDLFFPRVAQTSVAGATGATVGAPSTTGMAAQNVVGTDDAHFIADGSFIEYTTTTVSGNPAAWLVNTTLPSFRFDGRPFFRFIMKTGGDITNLVYWIGYIPQGGGGTRAAFPASFCVFRWNPNPSSGSADTTNWAAVTTTAASAGTATDTTVAVVADTIYEFHILIPSTNQIEFYINKVLVATHTQSDNVPADTIGLGPTLHIVNGTSGATRVIRVSLIRGRYEPSHYLNPL